VTPSDYSFNVDIVSFCGEPIHIVAGVLGAIEGVEKGITFVVGALYKKGCNLDAIMLLQLSGVDNVIDAIEDRAAHNSGPPESVSVLCKGESGDRGRKREDWIYDLDRAWLGLCPFSNLFG
jgi:hypothetical protein